MPRRIPADSAPIDAVVKDRLTCTGLGNGWGGCGAAWRVYIGDLFETSHNDNAVNDTTYCTEFRCPTCRVVTGLPDIDHTSFKRLKECDLTTRAARRRMDAAIAAYVDQGLSKDVALARIYDELASLVEGREYSFTSRVCHCRRR